MSHDLEGAMIDTDRALENLEYWADLERVRIAFRKVVEEMRLRDEALTREVRSLAVTGPRRY